MRTLAVTSGKGGVGKTTLSANLALALQAKGRRVCVFDADLGLANVDLLLGVRPKYHLGHVVLEGHSLAEAVHEGPGGIHLLAGGSGLEAMASLDPARLDPVLEGIAGLSDRFTDLIFDTSAGIHEHVLRFLAAADETLLVVTPDPTSLLDGYAAAKGLITRKRDAQIRLVVNSVANPGQGRAVQEKMTALGVRFLGRAFTEGGCIHRDDAVVDSGRTRIPLLLSAPRSRAARDINALADRLMAEPAPRTSGLLQRLREAFTNSAPKAA